MNMPKIIMKLRVILLIVLLQFFNAPTWANPIISENFIVSPNTHLVDVTDQAGNYLRTVIVRDVDVGFLLSTDPRDWGAENLDSFTLNRAQFFLFGFSLERAGSTQAFDGWFPILTGANFDESFNSSMPDEIYLTAKFGIYETGDYFFSSVVQAIFLFESFSLIDIPGLPPIPIQIMVPYQTQQDVYSAGARVEVPTRGSAPEPATLALLGIGLAGIGYQRRRILKMS